MEEKNSLDGFKNAVDWNKLHHENLNAKKCHFRGGFGGTSLISLHPNTPESGISGVTKPEVAIADIHNIKKPERNVPEKQLQAWLIYKILYGEKPRFWKDLNLSFLTSELRWGGKNNSTVNDILAIDAEGALWVIELKSKRSLKELKKQLDAFSDIIESNRDVFKTLVDTFPTDQKWDGRVKKMIIWPESPSGKPPASTKVSLEKTCDLAITYTHRYEFQVESGSF